MPSKKIKEKATALSSNWKAFQNANKSHVKKPKSTKTPSSAPSLKRKASSIVDSKPIKARKESLPVTPPPPATTTDAPSLPAPSTDPDSIQGEIQMELKVLHELLGKFDKDYVPKYDLKEDEEEMVEQEPDAADNRVTGIDKSSGISYLKKKPIGFEENASKTMEESSLFKALMFGKDETDVTVQNKTKAGKYLAIDCEMVGVGPEGYKSALARVSIVNYFGHVLLDSYVKPQEQVTDFRTQHSGITAAHLKQAVDFDTIQTRVASLIANKIIIGHSIKNDFSALNISHPPHLVRDTASYLPHKQFYHSFTMQQKAIKLKMDPRVPTKLKSPPLRFLAKEIIGLDIQNGQRGHCSIEDARVAMMLYRKVRTTWEASVRVGKIMGMLK